MIIGFPRCGASLRARAIMASTTAAVMAAGFLAVVGLGPAKALSSASTSLILQNGWRPAPGTVAPSFLRAGNDVVLRGGITGGPAGRPLATLPLGSRPAADEWFAAVTANSVVAPLVIHPDGDVVLAAGDLGFVSLEGIAVEVNAPAQALPTYGGWAPAPGTDRPGFVSRGGYVELVGGLTAGAGAGVRVAGLPPGERPPADEWFPAVTAGNVIAPLVIHPNGDVVASSGAHGFLSLAGLKVLVGTAPPANLPLANGWHPAGGTNAPGFTRSGSEVDLLGGLSGGQIGQPIATLPAGTQPPADEWFATVTADNAIAPLVVHANGQPVLNAGRPGFLSLEGLRVNSAPPPPPAAPPAPTKGPVGWDTYRQLSRLPTLTTGVEALQSASTDPRGQNHDFDHTLGRTADGSFILASHAGPGEIDNIWTTSRGGDVTQTGNITITLDGRVVLDAPEQDVVDGKLGAPFTFPLVADANQSSGGDSIDVPMPFQSSMTVTTTHDPDYYHVGYRSFPDSAGVTTFDPTEPATDVVAELAASGTRDPLGPQPGQTTTSAAILALPGSTDTVGTLPGPGRINGLQIQLPDLAIPAARRSSTPVVATGGTTIAINPHNSGVRLTRQLQAGTGAQPADVVVGGRTVGRLPGEPGGGPSSNGAWTPKEMDLAPAVTAGQSAIEVRPSGPAADRFSYRVAYLPSAAEQAADAAAADLLANVRLQISFDGQQTVDAPLGQFFGSGLGGAQVQSLMVAVNPATHTLSAWWPMPYAQSATVALYNGSSQILVGGTASVTSAPAPGEGQALGPGGSDGYFHATANAQSTVAGQDYSFLQTAGVGKVVGVSAAMQGLVPPLDLYLEGNEQVFVDGSAAPQIDGTGTEDFFDGGWYFNRGPFSDPLNGNPASASTGTCAYGCTAAYRLLIADAVPFASSIRFGIQHGPVNDTPAMYASTTDWYGR